MESPIRLLLVDASATDASLLQQKLDQAGLPAEVMRVDTADQYLQALQSASWDLVLSDYPLEGFHGMMRLEMLQALGSVTPLIFLSRGIPAAMMVEAVRRGAADFVPKDSPAPLIPAIRREVRAAKARRRILEHPEGERRTEVQYRHLLDSSAQGVCVHSDFRVLYANPAFARLHGFGTLAELQTLGSLLDLVFPEDRQQVIGFYEARMRDEAPPTLADIRVRRRDGTPVWIDLSASAVTWDNRPALLVHFADRTQRREAEQSLRASERLLRSIVDTLPVELVVKDAQARYVMVNPAWLNHYGLAPEQVIGKAIVDIPRQTEEERRETLTRDQLTLAGQEQRLVFRGWDRTATGELRHYQSIRAPLKDETGSVVGLVGATIDLTEQKRAEQDLRANQTLLRTMFDAMPHPVMVKDRDSRYLMVNRAWCERYGTTPEQVIGVHTLNVAVRGELQKRVALDQDEQVLASGQTVRFEGVGVIRQGERRHYLSIKSPLRDDKGEIMGIAGIVIDTTDATLAEREARAAHRLLQTIFDAIPYLLAVKDTKGQFLMVNRAWCAANGLAPDQVLGKRADSSIGWSPDTLRSENAEDVEVLSNGNTVTGERDLADPRGGFSTYHSIKSPLRGEQGEIAGLVGLLVEKNERRKSE